MRANTRAFAMNNYPELKMLNPSLPILVREGTEAMPTLTARFGARALSQPVRRGHTVAAWRAPFARSGARGGRGSRAARWAVLTPRFAR